MLWSLRFPFFLQGRLMFFFKTFVPSWTCRWKNTHIEILSAERICLFDQDVNSTALDQQHFMIPSNRRRWMTCKALWIASTSIYATLSKAGEDVRWNVFGCSILMNMKRFIESNKFQIYIALYVYVIVKYADYINPRHVWCEHSIPVKISLCMYYLQK